MCGCQLCCSRSVGRGWKLKMENHLCVILYRLHLGVTAPLLAVCSSQRGLHSCTPDLKPQPKSLQGILPAWGVVCGTAGGSAAWIPRSVPIPTDCQHRDHGKAAASLPPECVLCVSCCHSWSLLLAFPLPKGIRISSVPCVWMCAL